jgi:hypothetical protein
MIARLRERSRPLRPEASFTQRFALPSGEGNANGQQKPAPGDLLTRLERMEDRLRELESSQRSESALDAHTLFLSTSAGYSVIERPGPPPQPGEEIELDGHVYRAQRHRHSPFPADPRPCVVLEANVIS